MGPDVAEDPAAAEQPPDVLEVALGAPYALGVSMVTALEQQGGNAGVDQAFHHPPASDLAFLDPTTALQDTPVRKVAAPDLPAGAKRLGKAETLGALELYLTLANGLPASEALAAADRWRGDRTVTSREGGRVCVRVDVVGETPDQTALIGIAVAKWAATRAPTDVALDTSGGRVVLRACDPGKSATAPTGDTLQHALTIAASRDELVAAWVGEAPSPEAAKCLADGLVADPIVDAVLTRVDAGTADYVELEQAMLDAIDRHGEEFAVCADS